MRLPFIVITLIAVLCSNLCTGQGPVSTTNPDAAYEYMFPSPDVAALAKYNDPSVGYSSGSVNLEIPLHTVQGGSRLSAPVSIRYQGSGVLVNQIASVCGLGFDLIAGGSISRTVRGIADEESGGYLSVPFMEDLDTGNGINPQSSDFEDKMDHLVLIADGFRDSQPDLFSFNFNGYGGQFILNQDGTVTEIAPYQDIKIIFNNPSSQSSNFTVQTPDGLQYEFGSNDMTERSYTRNRPVSCGREFEMSITAWHLTRIYDPVSEEAITFEYQAKSLVYATGISETQTTGNACEIGGCGNLGCYEYTESRCQNEQHVLGAKFVSGIVSSTGRIDFTYDTNRQDFNGLRLTDISIKDKFGTELKKYLLEHSYFTSPQHPSSLDMFYSASDRYRLKLDKITEISGEGTPLPPYEFDYQFDSNFPYRMSFSQDYYGYANGVSYNPSLISDEHTGLFNHLGAPVSALTGDRRPTDDINILASGLMQKITYPLGGSREFEFEPNIIFEEEQINLTPNIIETADAYKPATSNDFDPIEITTPFYFQGGEAKLSWHLDRDENFVHNSFFVKLRDVNGNNVVIHDGYGVDDPMVGFEHLNLSAGSYVLVAKVSDPGQRATINIEFEDPNAQWITDTIARPIGGVRIKKIIALDGVGGIPQVQSYLYNSTSNNGEEIIPKSSSVEYQRFPLLSWTYYQILSGPISTSTGMPIYVCGIECRKMTRRSSGFFSPSIYQGKHYTYKEVTVLNGETGEGGKTWYRLQAEGDMAGRGEYRGIELSNYIRANNSWANGTMLEMTDFAYDPSVNRTFRPVYSEEFEYSKKNGGQHTDGTSWILNVEYKKRGKRCIDNIYLYNNDYIGFEYIPFFSQWNALTKKSVTYYPDNGGAPTVVNTFFEFDDAHRRHTMPIETRTVNSDGSVHSTRMKYVLDYGDNPHLGSFIGKLKGQHQISLPIETTQWIQKPTNVSEQLIGGAYLEFKDFGNGKVLPFKTYSLEIETPLNTIDYTPSSLSGATMSIDFRYVHRGSFSSFDTHANLSEYQKSFGIPVSFLWQHHGQIPIAKTMNASITDIAYTSFETNEHLSSANGQWSISGAGGGWDNALKQTGMQSFNLSQARTLSAGIQNSGLYTLSFWLRGGSIDITTGLNSTVVASYTSGNEWKYIETELNLGANSSVNLTGQGWNERIDEVRLHPKGALMITTNYDPSTLLATSITDENNSTSYFSYDEFQRFYTVHDQYHNLVGYNEYQIKDTTHPDNYVRSLTILEEGKSLSDITNLSQIEKRDGYQYFDGLGRIIQSVASGQSPLARDIVQITEYDAFGRQPKQYLPYTTSSANGAFRTNAKYEQSSFYSSSNTHATTNVPYAPSDFDNSPLARVKKQGAPGEIWQLNTGRTIQITNGVHVGPPIYNLSGNQAFGFASQYNNLLITSERDENGHIALTYTDHLGRQVATRRQAPNNKYADTYYLYNDFGNLEKVIPPEAIDRLLTCNSNNGSAPGGMLDLNTCSYDQSLIFQYRYDQRKRMIAKKIPGADWMYFVYDVLDRPVLVQDGNQKQQGKWTFTKYDQLGRPIITGIYSNIDDQASIQNWISVGNTNGSILLFEDRANSIHGYSNNVIPQNNTEILTVSWYDDYDFDRDGNKDVTYIPDGEYIQQPHDRIKGKLTGIKNKVLGSTTWLQTATWYDDFNREIQVQSENHLGGNEIIHHQYDFADKLLKTKRSHSVPGKLEHIVQQRFDYDHIGNVLHAYHKINANPEVRITANQYNELNELIEKNLHSTNFNLTESPNYLQSIDYRYNIRGWLEKINDVLIGTTVGGAEVSLIENGSIALEFDLQKVNDQGKGNVKLESNMELTKSDGSKEVETKSKEVQMEEVNSPTTYNTIVSIDLSDKVIQKSTLKESLGTLKDRVYLQLTNAGVTNADFIDAMITEVHRIFRDDWLRVRSNDDNDDLFSMRLHYTDANQDLNASSQYNGNISYALWQVKGQEVKGYGYQYDVMDRLQSAKYAKITNGFAGWIYQDIDRYGVSNLTYDQNGNIQSLLRKGMTADNNGIPTFGTIDILSYYYNGNQLTKVTDASTNTFGFKDGVSQNIEYQYDANGNLTQDDNKGIVVTYNHLNLPTVVDFGLNNRIEWLYDATGTKLQKKVFNKFGIVSAKDYVAGIEYVDGDLEAIYHDEGRAVPESATGPIIGSGIAFRYEYTLGDQLGNSRVMFSDLDADGTVEATEILQVDDYYPFGLAHQGTGSLQIGPNNKYQYNGKVIGNVESEKNAALGMELVSDYDLNIHHSFFRVYDPQLGRTWQIDPLSASRNLISTSPYSWTQNNPLIFNDPNGDNPFKILKIIKRGYNVYKKLKKSGELTVKKFTKALKDEGVDELVDMAGDVYTIFDGKASYLDKAKAIIDLGGFTELNSKGNKAVQDIFKGKKGGDRAGKPFTPKGKQEVIDANKTKNGGKAKCEGCETETLPATQSKKGVKQSGDETAVDHKYPKAKGGDGSPDNGQVLCKDCNTAKSNKTSMDEVIKID